MTIHYHGTPISPRSVLYTMSGKCFCVSFAHPQDVKVCHDIGQSVLLDNGAFTAWKSGALMNSEWWAKYYAWVEPWIARPTTFAIIPDVIDAGTQEQDALIREWPHSNRGIPVWHMDEPIHRLLRLCDEWPKVAIGANEEYSVVGSSAWRRRMNEAFEELVPRHRYLPWLHMLRGMQTVRWEFPFASVDSTDVARNHNRTGKIARVMADAWDCRQTPALWIPPPEQVALFGDLAT